MTIVKIPEEKVARKNNSWNNLVKKANFFDRNLSKLNLEIIRDNDLIWLHAYCCRISLFPTVRKTTLWTLLIMRRFMKSWIMTFTSSLASRGSIYKTKSKISPTESFVKDTQSKYTRYLLATVRSFAIFGCLWMLSPSQVRFKWYTLCSFLDMQSLKSKNLGVNSGFLWFCTHKFWLCSISWFNFTSGDTFSAISGNLRPVHSLRQIVWD